jgi:DnaK suppressor protein
MTEHSAHKALTDLIAQQEAQIRSLGDTATPVAPDSALGRLTRVDAMQEQQRALAAIRAAEIRIAQAQGALRALENGDYGECRMCGGDIEKARLSARPEAPLCLECQQEREN